MGDEEDVEDEEDEGSLILEDSGAVPNGGFRPRKGILGGMFSLSSWLAIAFATAALGCPPSHRQRREAGRRGAARSVSSYGTTRLGCYLGGTRTGWH